MICSICKSIVFVILADVLCFVGGLSLFPGAAEGSSAGQIQETISRTAEGGVDAAADWERFGWKTAEDVKPFYEKYAEELNQMRDKGNELCLGGHGVSCISTFIEMELLYMRIRELRPRVVIEAAPNTGWSTFWLLNAMKANGFGNHHSFDTMRKPGPVIEAIIADAPNVKWTHHQGFMQDSFPGNLTTEELDTLDYIFIDMSHNKEIAEYYTEGIFGYFLKRKPVTPQERVILVSVHDVYNHWYPLCSAKPDHADPTVEGMVNVQWILANVNFVRNVFDWTKYKNRAANIKSLLNARQAATGYACEAGMGGIHNMRHWCDVLTLYWSLHIPGSNNFTP